MTFFDGKKKTEQPAVPTPEIELQGDQGWIRDKNGQERDVRIPKLTWA